MNQIVLDGYFLMVEAKQAMESIIKSLDSTPAEMI